MLRRGLPQGTLKERKTPEAYELYGVSGVVGPWQSCLAGTEQHSELREDDRKWTRQAKSSRKSFCSFVIAWESTTGSDCTLRRMEFSFSSRATIRLSSSSLRCWSSNTRSYIMFWVWKATGRTVHTSLQHFTLCPYFLQTDYKYRKVVILSKKYKIKLFTKKGMMEFFLIWCTYSSKWNVKGPQCPHIEPKRACLVLMCLP